MPFYLRVLHNKLLEQRLNLSLMPRRSLTLLQIPKGNGKAKAKASASSSSSTQAMHVLMWAEDQSMEVVDDETLPSASHVDAWSYSACTLYTTFTPAFHSSEPIDADGILPPILDTGATHCLLPLKWMTQEQAETCKRIHLKVASGATVRALLMRTSFTALLLADLGVSRATKKYARFTFDMGRL